MEASLVYAGSINYKDVITKFKELHKSYYSSRGCMISTLNDDFSKDFLGKHPDLVWEEKYNLYAEAVVKTTKININIFGKVFMVQLCRPIKKVHRFEYEDFFGFGGHCQGFSHDRIIMTFAESFDKELDMEYLLMTGTFVGSGEGEGEKCSAIDEQYIKNTLKLLVIGGYVKYWAAFNEFKKWFKERGFDYEIITDTAGSMTSFVFEDYEVENRVEKKVEAEVESDMDMEMDTGMVKES
jgi:hypothetical protein